MLELVLFVLFVVWRRKLLGKEKRREEKAKKTSKPHNQ